MEAFKRNHPFPFSKMLTFFRKEPFDLNAHYGKDADLPLKDGLIGKENEKCLHFGVLKLFNKWDAPLELL